MKWRHLLAWLALGSAWANGDRALILVQGAPGNAEYETQFQEQIDQWTAAATAADIPCLTLAPTENSRESLQKTLEEIPRKGGDLWLVLIGHGTFDGRDPKFNLAGDDITAREFGEWLKPFQRRVVVLAFFSASGAFLPDLAGANRVVLTSTKSGGERNYSRLGADFAASLGDSEADLDGDGMTSLLELSMFANDRMVKAYEKDQRIVPEHSLLDDNGDTVGREIRAIENSHPPEKDAKGRLQDGSAAAEIVFIGQPRNLPAEFLNKRSEIESRIRELKLHKDELNETRYYRELEALLLEMAQLYDSLEDAPNPQAE